MRYTIFLIVAVFIPFFLVGQSYQSVESVEYDASQNRWLASNGNSIIARAADGTLSFFGDAKASYGIEVVGNTLFAIADNNVIKGYDLETTEEVLSLSISGVVFLNGMTNDGANIYVTDFSTRRIYQINITDLSNPTWELIVDNTGSTPNGILYDEANNRLIYVNWGSNAAIKSVDLADNSISTIVANTGLGNIDGIDDDAQGNYYISSWSPNRITKYDANFENAEIITTPSINNPADIGYSMTTDTLAVPVGNNVVFVGFEPITSITELEKDFDLSLFPNPVSDYTTVSFDLAQTSQMELACFDVQGRLVKTFLNEKLVAGKHRIVLTDLDFPKGQYVLNLSSQDFQKSMLLIKE